MPSDSIEVLRSYAGLLFWRWYSENGPAIDLNNSILELFSGIAVYSENTMSARNSAAADAEFNASLPVFSASARLRGSISGSTSYWADTFNIASFSRRSELSPISKYIALPKPLEMKQHFGRVTLRAEGDVDSITLYNTNTFEFDQSVSGVVTPFCSTASWSATSKDGSTPAPSGLTLLSVRADENRNGGPTCLARFRYKPSNSDVSNGANLEFSLAYLKPIISKGTALNPIIAARPLTLKSHGKPDWRRPISTAVIPADPNNLSIPVGTPGSSPKSLQWVVEYQFVPAGVTGLPNLGVIQLTMGEVPCVNGAASAPIILDEAQTISKGGSTRFLQIKLSTTVASGVPVTTAAAAGVCQFSGAAKFTMNVANNPDVTTTLGTANLSYPLPI